MKNKIVPQKLLAPLISELKAAHKKIVSTNGVFDIMHVGHTRYLQAAKSKGDVLIVAVNADASVKRLKGEKRPINNQEIRMEMLASLACVDFVVLFEEDTPEKILEIIKPNVHVKGGDYKPADIIERAVIEDNDGVVELVALEKGFSTTNLIEKIVDVYGKQ